MNLRLRIAALSLGVCLATTACRQQMVSTQVKMTAERSRKLSVLAATEAGFIKDPDARLTRQLNIADQVLQRYGATDAVSVLGEASKTLRDVGGELGSHARISGWVSVSQLSRKAKDPSSAELAATEAQREVENLQDPAERCWYVLGVAEELGQLKGDAAATALIQMGGQWAKSIFSEAQRREARLSFAVALFNLNAYEGGVATLRDEQDPAWSSDSMLALASTSRAPTGIDAVYSASEPSAPSAAGREGAATKAPSPSSAAYGRSLGYEAVFKGSSSSRTAR